MPAIMTLGGIALAVLGLLIVFLGLPDRAAGLALGSDLIQTGASIFAGGLIVAALGQVLKALRDIADRVEEAGFGLGPRQSLNDELSDRAPVPLPRAARNEPAASEQDEFDTLVTPPARAARAAQPAPRTPAPAPRTPAPAPRAVRPAVNPRQQPEPNFDGAQQDEDFADDFPQQEPRPEPRWMRTQAETNNRQQAASGTIPLQSTRTSRATPAAPAVQPRREAAAAPQPKSFEAEPRRRAAAPQMDEAEHAEPTVVRSGIIAGMAYTLYSDRSIEAELPAGTVRFGSIEELQEHVRRAGVEEQDEYRGPNGAQH